LLNSHLGHLKFKVSEFELLLKLLLYRPVSIAGDITHRVTVILRVHFIFSELHLLENRKGPASQYDTEPALEEMGMHLLVGP
jgi:hypothetical protein